MSKENLLVQLKVIKRSWYFLGTTHLFPPNELVHLAYIAVATNTRAD